MPLNKCLEDPHRSQDSTARFLSSFTIHHLRLRQLHSFLSSPNQQPPQLLSHLSLIMATSNKEFSHSDTNLKSTSKPISLRTLQLQDAQRFVEVLAVDPMSKPMEIATAQSAIGRMQESAREPSVLSGATVLSGPSRVNLAVMLHSPEAGEQDEGHLIGIGGYGAIKTWEREGKKVRAGDVGVVIDPAERSKGYAVEAMRLAIDWAFASLEDGGLQLDLVTVTTEAGNTAMARLIDDKLGLKGKGVLRDAENSGKELYYEMAPADWQAVR